MKNCLWLFRSVRSHRIAPKAQFSSPSLIFGEKNILNWKSGQCSIYISCIFGEKRYASVFSPHTVDHQRKRQKNAQKLIVISKNFFWIIITQKLELGDPITFHELPRDFSWGEFRRRIETNFVSIFLWRSFEEQTLWHDHKSRNLHKNTQSSLNRFSGRATTNTYKTHKTDNKMREVFVSFDHFVAQTRQGGSVRIYVTSQTVTERIEATVAVLANHFPSIELFTCS